MVGSNPGLHVLSCVIAGTLGSSLHGGFKPLFGCVLSCLNAGSLGSTLTSGVKPGLSVCMVGSSLVWVCAFMSYCRVTGVKSAWWGQTWFGCVLLCVIAEPLGSILIGRVKHGLGVCFHVLLLGHWGQLCMVGASLVWVCAFICYYRVIGSLCMVGSNPGLGLCLHELLQGYGGQVRMVGSNPCLGVWFHVLLQGHWGQLCMVGSSLVWVCAFMCYCWVIGANFAWWGQAWFRCVLSCVLAGHQGQLCMVDEARFGCVLSRDITGSLGQLCMVGSNPGLGVCFHELLQGHWSQVSMVGSNPCLGVCFHVLMQGHWGQFCMVGSSLVWVCAFMCYCWVIGVNSAWWGQAWFRCAFMCSCRSSRPTLHGG